MDVNSENHLLSIIGNEALIRHIRSLPLMQKQCLLSQLQTIDIPTLLLQKQLIYHNQEKERVISPFTEYSSTGNIQDKISGQQMISDGLVGCLIVAGGQGSRLRIEGPKGVCQVTKIRKKSLFQLIAEKTLAAGKLVGRPLSLAVMTSPQNHQDTVTFFEIHGFFGLEPEQISFFQQGTLPLLDVEGNIFLEAPDRLAVGPDGNGGALHQFFHSGLWQDWYTKGIRYMNFILIDNALADPFDAELVGYQKRKNSDIVIKCTTRANPNESVGILAMEKGKAAVVEYTELPPNEGASLNSDGTLKYSLANLSLFSFNMDFIADAIKNTQPILHKAFKAVKFLDHAGRTIKAETPMAWKFEKFIFDLLPVAQKVDALVYPRENCFAPLKNFSGNDSFDTVAEAIERRDQQILSEITGIPCTLTPLEISQDFYYPTPELLSQWKGKSLKTSGYVEES